MLSAQFLRTGPVGIEEDSAGRCAGRTLLHFFVECHASRRSDCSAVHFIIQVEARASCNVTGEQIVGRRVICPGDWDVKGKYGRVANSRCVRYGAAGQYFRS